MTRYILKRIGLALITLVLLSMIVFAVSTILPGNVGRAVLGPFAAQESVDALNEQLGTNRSIVVQYKDWVTGLLHGDLGTSLTKQVPAWDLLGPALANSFKLAFVAFIICVPLSILAGIFAALRYGKATDKGITTAGLSFSAMPEFVSGIFLILVFAIWLGWLPVTAQAEPGASLATQFEYLLLPAFTLTLVLLGYIARITRALDDRGPRQRLRADRAPQGPLEPRRHPPSHPAQRAPADDRGRGRPGRLSLRRPRRRRGAVQLPGRRQPHLRGAARQKDLPLLTAGVLVVGIVYLMVTLIADLLYAVLNPRIRFGSME